MYFDSQPLRPLDRLPPEIADLTALTDLGLEATQVEDISPLSGLTALRWLGLAGTKVSNLTPLAKLSKLQGLCLDNTAVQDLRPIRDLPHLGTGHDGGLSFADTPATAVDAELRRLSKVENDVQRTRETLAYLKTLPPWPEPLPWEVEAAQRDAPAPDPALPLVQTPEGIGLGGSEVGEAALDDPVRGVLHDELSERVEDLLRVAGNLDEGAYREGGRLRDLLAPGLVAMEPLKVHLVIEALRRIRARLPRAADRDLVGALDAVVEAGPGLTLDTPEVTLFLRRVQDNRLVRREAAEVEAEIRLANSIARSDLSAPDVASLARAAADPNADDQLSESSWMLTKNWVILLGRGSLLMAAGGVVGGASWDMTRWLLANQADVLVLARYWGEPFVAWIMPILGRAQQMAAGASHLRRGGWR
ncbi:MAG: leucine-rich repeat domain-containing protein [Alkalilacustris sp.]